MHGVGNTLQADSLNQEFYFGDLCYCISSMKMGAGTYSSIAGKSEWAGMTFVIGVVLIRGQQK
jgi:hypothetical protein